MAEFGRLLPPLATLVAFEAAYRHRNFTRAAEELYQSQATVGRRVRELEADLGVCLFERHRYDVTPTPEAETFVASVLLSLGELSSSADRIRRQGSGIDSLTILISTSLASAAVAPILGGFQQQHPDLKIRVLSSCEPIESTQEQFDIALQYGSCDSERFEVEFIADEAVFPVCSPSLAAGLPTPATAADLASMPLLHVDYDDPRWATWSDLLAAPGSSSASPDRAMVFSSYQLCLDVAEQGDGVALGWERSVRPRIEAGTLIRIPGFALSQAGRINAYLTDHAATSTYGQELVALLRDALTDDEA